MLSTMGGVIVGTVATRTPPAAQRGRNRDLFSDGLFLVAIVLGSAALYVTQLGFYSDDWAFLGSLTTHGDHSAKTARIAAKTNSQDNFASRV